MIINNIFFENTLEDSISHKNLSLNRLNQTFEKHIELEEYKKCNLLAYWISEYSNYHDEEKNFESKKLKRYKRGDIIKANLGFNVGRRIRSVCIIVLLLQKMINHLLGQ